MKKQEKQQENQAQRIARAQQMMEQQVSGLQTYTRRKVIEDQGMEVHDQASFTKNYEIMMHRGRAFLCSLDILEDVKLSAHAKILFQIISCLCINEGYCYASNGYLAEKIGKSEGSLKQYLDELDKQGFIKRDAYKTSQGYRRNIYIQFQNIKDKYFTKPKESTAYKIPKRRLKGNGPLSEEE